MILVVDDDPDLLGSICRTLRPLGEPIHRASDPLAAIEILAQEPISILLSDIDMPGTSGHDLMRLARELHPSIVRLLMTGRGSLESAVRAINEGEVHRFLCKPFATDEIRAVVRDALARRDELARASKSQLAAAQRRALDEQLEREYPGITSFERDEHGGYRLDRARAAAGERLAASLGMTLFRD